MRESILGKAQPESGTITSNKTELQVQWVCPKQTTSISPTSFQLITSLKNIATALLPAFVQIIPAY
jgi:hypothetical protein